VDPKLVQQALLTARTELGMEVGYFSEFVGTEQIVRGIAGDAASFGLEPGTTVPLADSYCGRVVDGRLPSLVPDTAAEPEVRDLPATAAAGLRAYVGVPLSLPDGRLYGTLCAASHSARPDLRDRDVAFLRVLADVLAQVLAREAERAAWAARLERANAELAAFAHVVAHDLTEPMRTVSGLAQLLARRSGECGELADAIVGEVRRTETMVDDLLRYARAGGDGERERVDLGTVVGEVTATLRDAIEREGARLHVGPLPVVPGVRTQLHQVMQNLLANALKFRAAAPPVVTVAAHPVGGDAAWGITVSDNGLGIAPEDRERIFAAFGRGASGAGRPGSGIGLAVCAKVAAAHGGELTVGPAPGGGSVFTLVLPAA
jgi:signal transduction histidine kinase